MVTRRKGQQRKPSILLRPRIGYRMSDQRRGVFHHPFLPSPEALSASTFIARAQHVIDRPSCSFNKQDDTASTLPNARSAIAGPSQPFRKSRDEAASPSTLNSASNLSIGPSEISASSGSDLSIAQDDFEEITREEASVRSCSGWVQNVDRMLCFLWFFTPYSFNMIAALLNYSCARGELVEWLYGVDVKVRLLQLMGLPSYDDAWEPESMCPATADEHCFIYHEVRRMFLNKKLDPSKHFKDLEKHLKTSWDALRAQLHRADTDGRLKYWKLLKDGMLTVGVGLDNLSDEELGLAGERCRRWGPELRQQLLCVRSWTGLRRPAKKDVQRPTTVDGVANFGVDQDGNTGA